MKPDIETPNIKIEQAPAVNGRSIEVSSSVFNPEATRASSIEKGPQRSDAASMAANASIAALPTPVSAVATTSDDSSLVGAPAVAKDDDLIEKEWVDKAKQIVNQTKNDPHQRETGVTKLKVDYLKKRFGRELGSSE